MTTIITTSNRDLIATNPAIAIGDCLCVSPNTGRLTLATPTALAAAGNVYAIAAAAAAANSGATIAVHELGEVPASVTGLGAGSTATAVVDSSGRVKRAASTTPFYPGKDYVIGSVTTSGSVMLQPHRPNEVEATGVYDVRAFGAVGDGTTDDSPAFAAMFKAIPMQPDGRGGATINVPAGNYKLNSDLEITRCVIMRGGGPGGNGGTRLTFAAGKGIVVQSSFTSKDDGRPQGAVIEGFDIRGTRPTGIAAWQANTAYAVGAKVENLDLGYGYAECISAGTSNPSAGFVSNFPPAYDDTITFPPNTYVSIGTRIRGTGIFSVVFECTTAGQTGASEPVWSQPTGTTTASGSAVFTSIQSPFLQDGTCWWAGRVHSAVHMRQAARIENCYIQNFYNAGVLIWASVPRTNANNWNLRNLQIAVCGMGVMALGTDVNAGLASNIIAGSIGYKEDGSAMSGNACHAYADLAFLSNTWLNCTAETAKGRAFYSPYPTTEASFIACYSENTQPSKIQSPSVVVGGIHGAGFEPGWEGTRLHSKQSNNIRIVNNVPTFRPEAFPVFTGSDSAVWTWHCFDEVPNVYFGWRKNTSFEPPRSWGLGQIGGGQYQQNFLSITDGYGPDGMGWRDSYGHYCGFGDIAGFSPSYFLGVDKASETYFVLRGGKRKLGDRFEPAADLGKRNAYMGRVVTTAGYRGKQWNASWSPPFQYEGNPGYVVEPTVANGFTYRPVKVSAPTAATEPTWPTTVGADAPCWIGLLYREVGELVIPTTHNGFYYEVASVALDHKNSAAEPTWPVVVGNTVTDGNVTWRCKGTTPAGAYVTDGGVRWVCIGPVAKLSPYMPIYEKASLTTTNATQTVLDSYPVDLNSTEHFEITVTGFISAGASSPGGVTLHLEAAFYNSGGVLTQLGTTSTVRLGNATCQAVLVANGTNVELRVTGIASNTVQWKSRRQPQ